MKTYRLYDKQDQSLALFAQFVGELTEPQASLHILANKIDWQRFEAFFSPLYYAGNGFRQSTSV